MGRNVEVCGECMQPIDKNNQGHSRHCTRNASNLSSTGQMIHDRGPEEGRSSPLDDVAYQAARDKDIARFQGILDKRHTRNASRYMEAANRAVGKMFRGTTPTPDKIPYGCKAIKVFGGYKVVLGDNPKSGIDGIKGNKDLEKQYKDDIKNLKKNK